MAYLSPVTVSKLVLLLVTVEFLFLRVIPRLGPVLPTGDTTAALLLAASHAGLTALNAAVLLTLATLLLFAAGAGASPAPAAFRLAALLAAGAGLAGLGGGKWAPAALGPFLFLAVALTSVTVMALARTCTGGRGRTTLPLTVTLAAYLAAYYYFLARTASAFGLSPGKAATAAAVAEALFLAVAPLATLAVRPSWNRQAFTAAAAVTGVLIALQVKVGPWLLSTLAMWNFGLSAFLPLTAYVAAAGLYVYAVLALLAQRATAPLAIGLGLVAFAGLKLDYTYFNLLGTLGFLLMATAYRGNEVGLWTPVERTCS